MAYNRQAAVDYARKWWNSANPAYPTFQDDCTNFISQCLRAGGATMTGYPNRSKGWWIQGRNWSYSWSVVQALRNYLDTSRQGLQARRVYSVSELELGDIIFLDFEGDGRMNHSLLVTSFVNGEPYVHAHTYNSANRHYLYKDSSAYTPNIKYYFYHIIS